MKKVSQEKNPEDTVHDERIERQRRECLENLKRAGKIPMLTNPVRGYTHPQQQNN